MTTQKVKTPLYIWIISIVACCFALISIFVYSSQFSGAPIPDHERWGQVGDFFGGVLNPSFSFLSLIALLLTLRFQSEELKLTRNELEQSTKALQGQARSLNQQNFDNTFFNLLKLHNEIVESLTAQISRGEPCQGRQSFVLFVRIMNMDYENLQLGLTSREEQVTVNNFMSGAIYSTRLNSDHYFRNLYRIVKFIHDKSSDKPFYIGTLRAQLSPHELAAIFFNGLTDSGRKFKPLIEQYALLDNIKISLLPKRERLIHLYDRKAFGECDIDGYLSHSGQA